MFCSYTGDKPNYDQLKLHRNRSNGVCRCPTSALVGRCVESGGGKQGNSNQGGTSKSAINKQKRYEKTALEGMSICNLVVRGSYFHTSI